MELYSNPAAPVPDYRHDPPALLPRGVRGRRPGRHAARACCRAGATPAYEETLPDGSFLIMLRDPWGIPLQLVRRATPFPAS